MATINAIGNFCDALGVATQRAAGTHRRWASPSAASLGEGMGAARLIPLQRNIMEPDWRPMASETRTRPRNGPSPDCGIGTGAPSVAWSIVKPTNFEHEKGPDCRAKPCPVLKITFKSNSRFNTSFTASNTMRKPHAANFSGIMQQLARTLPDSVAIRPTMGTTRLLASVQPFATVASPQPQQWNVRHDRLDALPRRSRSELQIQLSFSAPRSTRIRGASPLPPDSTPNDMDNADVPVGPAALKSQ